MEIEQIRKGDLTILRLIGELELSTCREIDVEMRQLLGEAPKRVIVDLKETRYVDSSGLGILVSLFSHVRKLDGRMVVSNPNRSVKRLFDLTNVQQFLPIFGSLDEAQEAFK